MANKLFIVICIFFINNYLMKSQSNNQDSVYIVFYIDFDSNVKVVYYPYEKSIYLVDKNNEKVFNSYDELKNYVKERYDRNLKESLEDNFSNSMTNRNFFLGQNENNVSDIFKENELKFCAEYNIDFKDEKTINDSFNNNITHLKNSNLDKFLEQSEIPLLLYIESYVYNDFIDKKCLNISIKTSEEQNALGEKYFTKLIYFNNKKFNPISSIRFYFNELLFRNKWIKKGSPFDIKVLKQFVNDDIALIFNK